MQAGRDLLRDVKWLTDLLVRGDLKKQAQLKMTPKRLQIRTPNRNWTVTGAAASAKFRKPPSPLAKWMSHSSKTKPCPGVLDWWNPNHIQSLSFKVPCKM